MTASLASYVTTTAGMAWLVSCALRAALLLAASWLGAALLRRGPAAARHQIWTLGVVGALLLPVLCWALPSLSLASAPAAVTTTTSLDAPAIVVTPGAATGAAPTWPAWLALTWAAGALVIAIRLVRGQLAARRLVRTATPAVAASWSAAMHDAAASLALTTPIQLLRSATVISPMTIGVLRPRVLLPVAADDWSPQRLRAVLVHELGHVRRHDTLIQLAASLGCALYWWNPLAWLAAARLRIEREHACDDLVLGAGILPSSYAADLLEVARSLSASTHAHVGASCMVDRSWTEARLRRILDATTSRRPLRAVFRGAACGLTLAGAVTLACTSSRPALPPADDPPAPASLGTLSVGAPFVRPPPMFAAPVRQGALDLSLVAAEVQRRLGSLEQCYERRLAVKPALSGTVVIHWVIDEAGMVPEACITEDTVRDAEITDCVNKLVDQGHFPTPRGGAVDVSLPFVFTPRSSTRPRLSQAGS